MEAYHGLLVIDKPRGLSSRAVVDRAQGWFPPRTRLGHTGTLDPLATGVLVLGIGNATRLTEYVQAMDKEYTAEVHLGVTSDTDDAEGTITPVAAAAAPAEVTLRQTLAEFVGTLDQVPPDFSAAHIQGQRAYRLARRGKEVTLAPRPVHVYAIDLVGYQYPSVQLRVHCGKGTYIRSLARDLGQRLGCGAFLKRLRRTRIGPFTAEQGLSLEADRQTALRELRPIAEAVAGMKALVLDEGESRRLQQGQRLKLAEGPASGEELAVFDGAGNLLAVATYDAERQTLHPVKVMGR